MILVTYKGNWADEMDLFGYCIYDNEKEFQQDILDDLAERGYSYKTFDEILKDENDKGYCFSCGSNQEVWYNSIKHFVNAFTINTISDKEAKIIEKYLGVCQGNWPFWNPSR